MHRRACVLEIAAAKRAFRAARCNFAFDLEFIAYSA